jgi:hypothetical protein
MLNASIPNVSKHEKLISPQIITSYNQLIAQAKNEQLGFEERWQAVTGLVQADPSRAAKDLQEFLIAKPWFLRNAALLALDSLGPAEGKAAGLKLLSDKALLVRASALEVLQAYPDADVRKRLWEELSAGYNFRKKESLSIRSEIMRNLVRNPQKFEKNLFVQFHKDTDAQVASLAKSAFVE